MRFPPDAVANEVPDNTEAGGLGGNLNRPADVPNPVSGDRLLDAVVETDMDGRRAEVLVECARRRLPVLAEKPLAMNLEQLEAVRQAVQESGIRLSMLLTMRFESPYRVFRDLVLSGRVGKVCLASAQKSYKLGRRPAWQKDRRTFSGIIPFIGVIRPLKEKS